MKNSIFDDVMTGDKLAAWQWLKLFITNFLGNYRSNEYDKLLLNIKKTEGANVSQNALLGSHLNYFFENCGDLSEEQGKRFHLDIRVIEERY